MRLIDADALIEFCAERWIPLNVDAVNMQPTIQPVATDTNVGDTISRQAAIDIIEAGRLTKLIDAETAVNGLKGLPSAQPEWIPVMDGDGVLPEVDEDGYSDFVLVSFSNVSGLDIGQYREDENGGGFYSGDDDDPYTKSGAFVNAWMPLPKPYREEDLR